MELPPIIIRLADDRIIITDTATGHEEVIDRSTPGFQNVLANLRGFNASLINQQKQEGDI